MSTPALREVALAGVDIEYAAYSEPWALSKSADSEWSFCFLLPHMLCLYTAFIVSLPRKVCLQLSQLYVTSSYSTSPFGERKFSSLSFWTGAWIRRTLRKSLTNPDQRTASPGC